MTSTPLDRTLTASLTVAPAVYLIADLLYALRGWNDPSAAVVHVLGAVGYTIVLMRLVTFGTGVLSAVLLVAGAFGAAGNVAYGFNTIHVSLGDEPSVWVPSHASPNPAAMSHRRSRYHRMPRPVHVCR